MNLLDRPVPKPKGGCCCGPCFVKPGCEAAEASGENPEAAFFGLCCKCLPRFACIELVLEYGGCLGDVVIDPVTVEWDETSNSYGTAFNLPGRPTVDIRIGFENGPGEFLGTPDTCYVVLSSECMNYKRQGLFGQGSMDDTRLFQRLYDEEYAEPDRRTVCRELDVEFEVDLGRCTEDGYEGPECLVTVRLRPAEFVSREQKFTGDWDGYEFCHYRRVCITYKKDGERTDNYACYNEEYGFWETEFEVDGETLNVIISRDGMTSPTMLTLIVDGTDRFDPVAADCPDMSATWDLGYGATLEIKGDQSADCIDCRCFPRDLCVQLANDFDEPIWRGTLTWDEYEEVYTGILEDESLAGADPRALTLSFYCDECTGQTYMQWDYNGEWRRVAVECPEPSGAFIITEENASTTVLTFEPKGCADCFTASLVPCSGCPEGIPRILYATFVTLDEPDAQDCLNGVTIPLFWATHPGGAFWSGMFRCPDCSNCPGCEVPMVLNCPGLDEYGEVQYRLTFRTDFFSNPGATCDPVLAEFGPFANRPQTGETCTDVGLWGADDPDPTYKIVITA